MTKKDKLSLDAMERRIIRQVQALGGYDDVGGGKPKVLWDTGKVAWFLDSNWPSTYHPHWRPIIQDWHLLKLYRDLL